MVKYPWKWMLSVVMVAALALAAVPVVVAQPVAPAAQTTVCCGQVQEDGTIGPPALQVVGQCPPGWAATDCNGTPGWWGAFMDWASGKILYAPSQAAAAKIIAVLLSIVGFVEGLRRLAAFAAKWSWLLKLIPQVGPVLEWLTNGVGPQVLNIVVSICTMALAAFQAGQPITLGLLVGIAIAVIGAGKVFDLLKPWLSLIPGSNKAKPATA
jgi:hypothetical protein